MNITEEQLKKVISDPSYAITVNPNLSLEHDPLVSKEQWVEANVVGIEEVGAKAWLETLLEVLETGGFANEDVDTTIN